MRFLKELTGYHMDQGQQLEKLMDWIADAYRCRSLPTAPMRISFTHIPDLELEQD